MLTGPDVSHWQGAVDWHAVRGAGHSFAFAKASEGVTFVDSRFGQNWAGMQAAGLVRGAYHFLRSETDPAQQARHFVSLTGDLHGSMAVVDVERSAAGTNPGVGHVRTFAAEFAQLTGGHPLVVYTARWYWHGILGDPFGADIGPLWHARFSSDPGPLYGGWGAWHFWQHTETGSCPGIGGACDLDIFAYDMAELARLTGRPIEEDDLPYSVEQLMNIIRAVLDEGTAAGQLGWANTSKSTLAGIQGLHNLVLATRLDVDELVARIVAELPAVDFTREDVEAAVRTVMTDLAPTD